MLLLIYCISSIIMLQSSTIYTCIFTKAALYCFTYIFCVFQFIYSINYTCLLQFTFTCNCCRVGQANLLPFVTSPLKRALLLYYFPWQKDLSCPISKTVDLLVPLCNVLCYTVMYLCNVSFYLHLLFRSMNFARWIPCQLADGFDTVRLYIEKMSCQSGVEDKQYFERTLDIWFFVQYRSNTDLIECWRQGISVCSHISL